MPPHVLLLTFDDPDGHDIETPGVVDALRARGATVTVSPWRAPAVADVPADVVVIRSTWDYQEHPEEFRAVLGAFAAPVLNPLDVVRWNLHKSYLLELAAAGVPTVPTTLVPAGSDAALPPVDAPEVVLKPAVSANAWGLGRFPTGSPAAADHLRTLTTTGDVLVQPYLPEIVAGERSVVVIGGRVSHGVRKTPAAGDFRVQASYGGTDAAHTPTDAEVAVAHAALACVPGGSDALLYARVDLVGPEDAPLLIELELVEPELFLDLAPGSAERFADALLARL
ncbi:ATP-grasp domain-containing protein [Cellulomonas sp. NPDC055163]